MRKLCILCVSFSLAIFFTQYFLPVEGRLPAAVICLLPGLAALFFKGPSRLRLGLISAGLVIGFLWSWGHHQLVMTPVEAMSGKTADCEAEVTGYPEVTQFGVRFMVKLTYEEQSFQAILYTDAQYNGLKPGDKLSLKASFAMASQLGDETITSFTSRGVFLLAYEESTYEVEEGEGIPWQYVPAHLARQMQGVFEELFPEEAAGFLQALVTGNRDNLSSSFRSSLSRTGLSHTVAISGMHLSFLVAFLYLFGKGKRRTALITMGAILFFVAFAGGSASVIRAAVMQIMLLAAQLFGREPDPPTSISFALAFLLALNPMSAANIGLQLSFASIIGIFLFSKPIYAAMVDRWRKWAEGKGDLRKEEPGKALRAVLSSVSCSIGVQVLTVPLVAYYFGTVSLISVLANLLTLWAVSIVFVGGMLAGFLSMLWLPLGKGIAFILSPVIHYLLSVIRLLGNLPFAAVYTVHNYTVIWLTFVCAVVAICCLWPRFELWRKKDMVKGPKIRLIIPACVCVWAFCIMVFVNFFTYNQSELTLSVLDVGQGQSVVVLSEGSALMVDCGGTGFDSAGDMAANYLQGMGIDTVEMLVLTHFHSDHANGVKELFARMDVLRLAVPNIDPEDELRIEILALAELEQAEVYFVEDIHTVSLGEIQVILYPPLGSGGGNEEGLTVLSSAGEFDVLITGDMNSTVEKRLIDTYPLPDIEVLVVGHHGSKHSTSEALLQATTPEYAVISVGGNNSYGHPTQETLDRLEAENIDVYRTDLEGIVTIQAK